jgi:hypothetical protein
MLNPDELEAQTIARAHQLYGTQPPVRPPEPEPLSFLLLFFGAVGRACRALLARLRRWL